MLYQNLPRTLVKEIWPKFGSIAIAFSLWILPTVALAEVLSDWQFDQKINKLQFKLPPGVQPKVMVQEGDRLSIDLPNTEIGTNISEVYQNGPIRQINLVRVQPNLARIIIEFTPGAVTSSEQLSLVKIDPENRWVFSLINSTNNRQLTGSNNQLVNNQTAPVKPESVAENNPIPANQVDRNLESKSDQIAKEPMAGENTLPPIEPIFLPLINTPKLETGQPPTTPTSMRSNLANNTIPFGKPLPPPSVGNSQPAPMPIPEQIPYQPPSVPTPKPLSPIVLLPKGTTLKLIYPGSQALSLKAKPSRQEVLLLQGGIMDRYGQLIIPPNTPIIGRFESNRHGSRFIVQAINLYGRTIPIGAKSSAIDGNRRVSESNLIRNTSIGGLALLVISGFSGVGLLAGAAAGATATYVTAPQPATIQPGQIIEVRLTEDLGQIQLNW